MRFFHSWIDFQIKIRKMSKKKTLFVESLNKKSVTYKSCVSTYRRVCMKQNFDLGFSKKVLFFFTSFFSRKWPKFMENIDAFTMKIFKTSWFCIQSYVFWSTCTLGGSEKPHYIGLKLFPKNALFLFKCPFFVTKTLKCNV